jgi:hypothetical protein
MTYSGGLVSAKLLRAIQDGIVFEVTGNGATTSYIYYLRHFSFGEAA